MAAAARSARATLRLSGFYFAMATLAFAEMMRIAFELFTLQVEVGGTLVGPNGTDGFGDIRYLFENGITPLQYMAGDLRAARRWCWPRSSRSSARASAARCARPAPTRCWPSCRACRVVRVRLVAAAAAGALAGLGGGLYAHLLTYVEPGNFNIMLGVHSLAYGLIGGLGTALGPVLGVLIDIGVLESSRLFAGYRMIVFGGLVAAAADRAAARPAGRARRALDLVASAKRSLDAVAARRLDGSLRRR